MLKINYRSRAQLMLCLVCYLLLNIFNNYLMAHPYTEDKYSIFTSGKITYSNKFIIRGTNTAINTLYFGPHRSDRKTLSYVENGWDILADLGINVIRVSGGGEGDVAHFNIENYPNEWAYNLEEFLSIADNYNIQITFHTIGNSWGTLFGPHPPEPGIVGTPINETITILEKLAGDNPLNHNFISDRRIHSWCIANEIDLSNEDSLNWCVTISDYIREKGGKTFISGPYYNNESRTWLENMDLKLIKPLIDDHVDFYSIHYYNIGIVQEMQENNESVYDNIYEHFTYNMNNLFLNPKYNISNERIIIGEFGIYHGYGIWGGEMYYNLTEKSVSDYYKAIYQGCLDLGIKRVFNYNMFSEINQDGEPIGDGGKICYLFCVERGEYIKCKTEIIKLYYN